MVEEPKNNELLATLAGFSLHAGRVHVANVLSRRLRIHCVT